ncbi:styrene monooxygenase/indole monooxygenase family protein [Fodinicola feengrottensis]|uniref:styrene monooxygenase/indole monooxygenase family protein n=1 Tax=Fodinicola feengrottensis TaxID=435914 RepID=UPI00244158B0|nr:styrene monooxygenase/indole monooxygenase family protein [Fodinicola feengrottensis]
MRRVLIVGAGQCGLQLALSLLAEGYDVTVMSARTPEEIRDGWPTSTQGMFGLALQSERDYGLNIWEDRVPHIEALHVALSAPPGEKALDIIAPVDQHAESTDQRVKMSGWLELVEQRGGTVIIYQGVTTSDLDGLAALGRYDLTIVAAGRGELGGLFDRNASRSPYTTPQRGLAVAYVHGLAPDPLLPRTNVGFNAIPGFGELFVIPALTLSGPCDILFWEAVPAGPLDLWQERLDPPDHLKRTLELIRQYVPWVYERCANVELTDARATLSGRFVPTVRHPVGELPSGGAGAGRRGRGDRQRPDHRPGQQQRGEMRAGLSARHSQPR